MHIRKADITDFLFKNNEEHIILNVQIERSKPDIFDSVNIRIKNSRNQIFDLFFSNCYWLNISWSMGIVAEDCITSFTQTFVSEILDDIRMRWKKIGVDLDKLSLSEIVIDPSNGKIAVASMDAWIEEVFSN